ncbi:hypothetical protein ASD04_17820 [Devosia sp. Root436]|uniref:hypothetical protein n=1 Tax=Devosia sp. Root436 TaxID=1736537 RepID=UPI0006FFCAFC|nr:hypothetical protein [Devosia sp. Root436]KQX34099.1 hypothetical protein ASD04_17820 [Devosia sp. Root436]
MSSADEFPTSLAEIAEVIGTEAATMLANIKGGLVTYIPSRVDAGHWLSELIGYDLANKLCEHFRVGNGSDRKVQGQGVSLTVPMARYARQTAAWEDVLALGLTVSETAVRMGCHVRTVYRYRAKLGYSDGAPTGQSSR